MYNFIYGCQFYNFFFCCFLKLSGTLYIFINNSLQRFRYFYIVVNTYIPVLLKVTQAKIFNRKKYSKLRILGIIILPCICSYIVMFTFMVINLRYICNKNLINYSFRHYFFSFVINFIILCKVFVMEIGVETIFEDRFTLGKSYFFNYNIGKISYIKGSRYLLGKLLISIWKKYMCFKLGIFSIISSIENLVAA